MLPADLVFANAPTAATVAPKPAARPFLPVVIATAAVRTTEACLAFTKATQPAPLRNTAAVLMDTVVYKERALVTRAVYPRLTHRSRSCLLCGGSYAARRADQRKQLSARTTPRAPPAIAAATRPSTRWERTRAARTSTARCAAPTAAAAPRDTAASRAGASACPRYSRHSVHPTVPAAHPAGGSPCPLGGGPRRSRRVGHLTHRGFRVRTAPTVTGIPPAAPSVPRSPPKPVATTPAALTRGPSAASTESTAAREARDASTSTSKPVTGAGR